MPSKTTLVGSVPTIAHVNEVTLVGELAAPAAVRVLPSGDEVATFRLTVRAPPPGPGPTAGRGAPQPVRVTGPTARSDSLDCAVWTPRLRVKVLNCEVGTVVQVTGALRHRYWRGPGGLASRYEVEVDQLRTGRSVRAGRGSP